MAAVVTMIGRLGDGLILAGSLQEDSGAAKLLEPQARAKQLIRKLHYNSPPKAALDATTYIIQYILEGDVVYLAISEKGVSQERVFTYLQEVACGFMTEYGAQVKQATRPYCFVEFDTTLQKLRRSVGGRRRVSGMETVQTELREVHSILRDNIDNVLERGASLTDLETRASGLSAVSRQYRSDARSLNRRSFYAKAVAASIVTGIIILYFFVL